MGGGSSLKWNSIEPDRFTLMNWEGWESRRKHSKKRRPWNRFLFFCTSCMTYGIVVPHPGESAGVGMNLEGSNRMGHDSFLTFATLGVLILYGEESLRSRLIRQIYRVHSTRCKHSSFILSLFWILYLPHSLAVPANKTRCLHRSQKFWCMIVTIGILWPHRWRETSQ